MIDCESCILKSALMSDTGKCYVSCLDLEDALRERDKKVRAETIKEIHRDLITEIDLLNSTDMTDANLYAFAVKIKEITDKLVIK